MQRSTSWPFQESAEEGNDQKGECSQPGCIWRRKIFNSWHGWPPVQDWRYNTSAHFSGPWQTTPILGLNDALQLNLVKLDKAVYEVDADAEDAFHQQVVTEYADLFDDLLGNLAARYTMRMDKSVTQVVKPARKIPQATEKKVKEELGNMVKKGIIVWETEPTEWVSQMVATRKKNGDVRMSGSRRFEQSSQTTTSSHAYCRWCGLQTGECEGLFNVGCEGWILAYQDRKTILSTYNVQYPIWEVQVSQHALWHQHSIRSVPASYGKTLKDIHAQSLSTTSTSGVLLKKNMMPTSGKLWRELDRLAWSWTSANASSGREASPSWDTHSWMKVWSLTQRRQIYASTRKPSSSSKVSRNDKLLEQVHQGLQWKNSHIARASPQRCRMELDWNPSASIWQTERWSHKSSCAEILWCRKACGVVCWRVQKRPWCCLPPGQCSSSLCFKSSFWCRNQICTDWKGTPCGRVCMQKVSWLHLWSQSDHRNWSQAFDHHHEEATSCCPSTLTENASSASAVWPTVCLQEGKRAYILHKGHMGADRTIQLASDVVYWPKSKMRQDIKSAVSQCSACKSYKAHLHKQPLINHPVPDLPWATVGADIFDWNHHQYLVMVVSYSGWFEMDLLPDSSSRTVISKMKRLFLTHSIPEKLLTDNGRQFVSREFELFAKEWKFAHITSSPYYAQSNGLAENAVKQAKQLLEKYRKDGSDVQLGLLNLRNTPRDGMGFPAQPLLSRCTHTTPQHQRSCWNPSHWARPGSLPSWRKSANSRNNITTSQHDISGLWNPMKWYACRQTKASRDLQWWSQLKTVPGHT